MDQGALIHVGMLYKVLVNKQNKIMVKNPFL